VYVITCIDNAKSYVGKAKRAADRWDQHRADARRRSPKSLLGRAFQAHGIDRFSFQVIEEYATEEEALEQEPFWIAYLGTRSPNGYNITTGGTGATHSQSTRAQMSRARKGKAHSTAHNEAVAKSLQGNKNGVGPRARRWKLSDETRAKMSAARKGKPRSPETCAKMSAARKGRSVSEEQKAKISATLKGRQLSPEARANYLAAMERRRSSQA